MDDSVHTPGDIAARLVDGRAYGEAVRLYADFEWLRAHRPVSEVHADGFEPFWVVTRHADVLEISRNNELFRNAGRPTRLVSREYEAARRAMGTAQPIRSLLHMDAPDHAKYRALTQQWFSAHRVRQLEMRVRAIARARVVEMLSFDGECDFVRDVAVAYPLRIIMEILGVPPEDEQFMLTLTQQTFGSEDRDLNRTKTDVSFTEANRQAEAAVTDLSAYFRRLTAARRVEPRDDVASVIAHARVDGQPISDIEAMSYYVIIATAGHDTTSASISGALWALCERPREFAKVCETPGLIPALVEEAVRWTVPVQHFMRCAARDCEVRGVGIARGDWLMLSYLSGNRDEDVFDAPFEFRCDRSPNRHVSYGAGAHACLGQHLARLELRILFEELLPKLASLELAGEPRRSNATFVGGPKTLPIRFRRR